MAPGASSQCVGAGASHLSKLDLNNSLPLDNCNERTPDVGNQYLVVMLLLEAKLPSNFTSSVNYIVFRIAQFTDNKTLTCRILIKFVARFLKSLRFIALYIIASKMVCYKTSSIHACRNMKYGQNILG